MKIPNGKLLQGMAVGLNKFQAVTTLNQIEDYGLLRPTSIDKASRAHSSQEREAHELHATTNRQFTKARLENAHDYSGYIESVEVHGRPGGTPAITLYHPEQLAVIEDGVVIPYNAKLVAIDGETQTEARYELRERLPETGNNPVAITLYHGISAETAQQILHDYNIKGLRWTETKLGSFNNTGALSVAVEEALTMAELTNDQVNYRSAKATKKTVVSQLQALTLAAGYQLNGAGTRSFVSGAQLNRLNQESAVSVPPSCVQQLAHILRAAEADRSYGLAPLAVWQIAGVLLSKNVPQSQLRWRRAIETYNANRKAGLRKGELLGKVESAMRG
jgi:hypothetical protein